MWTREETVHFNLWWVRFKRHLIEKWYVSCGLTSLVTVFNLNCSNIQNTGGERVVEGRGPQTGGNPGQPEWRGSYPQAVLRRQWRQKCGLPGKTLFLLMVHRSETWKLCLPLTTQSLMSLTPLLFCGSDWNRKGCWCSGSCAPVNSHAVDASTFPVRKTDGERSV